MFRTFVSFAVFVLLLSISANAATYFTGNLNAAQETPPNASTATGFGRVTLNEAETQIMVSVFYGSAAAPLTSNVTMGHIHTGAVGVSGPVTFDLTPPSSTFGAVTNKIFAINATQLADLKAGNMYFNIHTVNNPNGEIRGQLAVDSPYVAYMNGNQEVPPSPSTATGSAAVSVNASGTQAIVSMSWTGLSSNAFDGLMRQGRSGQGPTGGFFCDLLVPAISSGTSGDVLCHFTPAQMTALRQGQMYVHIITSMGSTFEIRGQIQRRRSTVVDFDGDGKTDYAIARQVGASAIVWWISNSGGGGDTVLQFGVAEDFNTQRLMACDFDGDGKDDMTIWRNSVSQTGFLVHQSSTGTVVFHQFGTTGDDPRIVNDYDGDGRCDAAVYRGGASATWFYRGSANNTAGNITYVSWGGTGDLANPGDFNGDGRADFRVQDGANWWTLYNGSFTSSVQQFGTSVMFGTPGDYDGDGKVDLAGTLSEGGNLAWYYVSTLNPNQNLYLTRKEWGPSAGTRTRAQGDYDGDGRSDYAVWIEAAPTGFWVLPSNGSPYTFFSWGAVATPDDFAVAGYNNR